MSIIMSTAIPQAATCETHPHSPIDPRLKPLLDHIASELADEYVRLIEAAAAAEMTADHSAQT